MTDVDACAIALSYLDLTAPCNLRALAAAVYGLGEFSGSRFVDGPGKQFGRKIESGVAND